MTGSPRPASETVSSNAPDRTLVIHLAFVALLAFGVAAVFLYLGARELRPAYHVFRNDPIPIRDLHGRSGPVEIEGRAEPDEDADTVTAPFTGTECLAYEYEAEELRSTGKSSSWHTLDSGMGGVDFLVSDDTGSVRVNPNGADLRLAETTERVSPGEELPAHLEAYVAATEDVEKQDATVNLVVTELHLGNEQRFTERRLDVGESVYVYGQCRRGPATEWGSNLVDAVVADGRRAPVFVVSDTDERGTAWLYVRGGFLRTVVGLLALAFGIYVVLAAI